MARSRTYLPEFRQQMVELVRSGRSAVELSREFGPSAQSLRRWVRAADGMSEESGEISAAEKEELQRLRRENQQLRMEREILAKAATWIAGEIDDVS